MLDVIMCHIRPYSQGPLISIYTLLGVPNQIPYSKSETFCKMLCYHNWINSLET